MVPAVKAGYVSYFFFSKAIDINVWVCISYFFKDA